MTTPSHADHGSPHEPLSGRASPIAARQTQTQPVGPAPVIGIDGLVYRWPGQENPALSIAHFSLGRGERVLLRGPSGSGKSTLLSAIAGVIDVPVGKISLAGTNIGALQGGARDRFRVDYTGMIFQLFNLIPWMSARDNVLLPCRFSGRRRKRAGDDPVGTAERLLGDLGLDDPALQRAPALSLSVGQQQRVAAARALIGAPDLILADEATSALDDAAKAVFVDLLLRECADVGSSLLFVSHDRSLDRHFDRVFDMADLNKASPSC